MIMNYAKLGKILLIIIFCATFQPFFAGQNEAADKLEKAAGHQQKAIYYFIQSMKNVKKRIVKGKPKPGKQVKKEKNPFVDKQGYKQPKMPPEKNPQVKLQKIIDQQNSIIEKIIANRKQPNRVTPEDRLPLRGGENKILESKISEKLAPKQEKVGSAIAELEANHPLNETVKKSLQQAMKSSHAAANLMSVNNLKLAELKADKTLSDLKEAMRKLEKISDKNFNKTDFEQNLELKNIEII